MSLNLLAVHDQITAKLKELQQDVYETSAPEDSKLRFDTNGMILPYIVATYSDMYESANGNGIVSSRYNTGVSYADIICVGPTERSARQVADLVRDKLTGFIPVDAGELRFNGGARYASNSPKLNRYEAELSFSFPVNVVW